MSESDRSGDIAADVAADRNPPIRELPAVDVEIKIVGVEATLRTE